MSIDTFSPLTSTLILSSTIVIGLVLLVWSADKFVLGAASIARSLGMSTFMIGLTVVALGTSAPEILVSSTAALSNNQGIAIGNAIGSNIANIGLVLGITALFSALPVTQLMKRREIPTLIVVTLVTAALLADQHLGFIDGLILLGGLVLLSAVIIKTNLNQATETQSTDEVEDIDILPIPKGIAWFLVALVLLLVSSKMLVWGASGIAASFGISEVIIGLTVVAIGTSLPELAASIASAMKGHHDLAIGNVVGSNILNLLAVLSLPGLLAPSTIEASVLYRDLPVLLAFTVAMALFACTRALSAGKSVISKTEGSILLMGYVAYTSYLVYDVIT